VQDSRTHDSCSGTADKGISMIKKTVMIYGAGQCGQMVHTYLKRDLTIQGFIDRSPELQDKIVDGLPVLNLERALDDHPDLIIIAVMNAEQNTAIQNQLMEKGIKVEQILSIRWMKDYLDSRFSAARLIAKEINKRKISGAVAELGVYQGEFAALINELFPERNLYLFDTFEGFDARDIQMEILGELSYAKQGHFQDTSIDLVRSKLNFPERAIFKKGYFPESAEGLNETFAFVSIDADLYNPVYEGLNYFYPRMNRGGYLLIHDYNNLQFKGAGKAVEQYCSENNLFVVPLSDIHGSAVIVKP
jgi:O-methyltransferase